MATSKKSTEVVAEKQSEVETAPKTETPPEASKKSVSLDPNSSPEEKKLDGGIRITIEPFRKMVVDMTARFDTEVQISSNQLSSKYPKIQVIVEEFLNRIHGEEGKFTVGFFNYDDLVSRSPLGWYALNRGSFDMEAWPPGTEQRLGVWIDAADAIRIDNKYVCFILTEQREKNIAAWDREIKSLQRQARRGAGHDKPFTDTDAGEFGAQFEDTEEIIQHQKRKQVG